MMEGVTYSHRFLDYRPIERRREVPLKRLPDRYEYNREAKTGHLLAQLRDKKKKKKKKVSRKV